MKKFLKFCLISLLLSSCSEISTYSKNSKFKVVLEKNESFVGLDGYTRDVVSGGSASFMIKINEEYKFESLNTGYYENGKIKIDNINQSTRVIVNAQKLEKFAIEIVNDSNKGTLSNYPAEVIENSDLSITVTTNDDYEFIGWSLNSSLDNGGKFVSASNTLHLNVEGNTQLFTNYINKEDATYIYYYLNGGSMLDGTPEALYKSVVPIFTDRVKHPNTSIGTDKIYKDGHTLYSWNTKEDCSGLDVGLGSRIDHTVTPKLYAKWVSWTELNSFSYNVYDEDCIEITDCTSTESVIVVPEFIEGKRVARLKTNSFSNLNCQEIVLPKGLTHIENSAFINLYNLVSIKLFDCIESASDKALNNCPNFQTYKINAVIEPRYNKATSNAIDYLNSLESKKTIICGGSIVYTSIVAETFLAKSGDFELGICSGDVAAGFRFYIELACALARPGDIVAGVPLYWGGAIGGNGNFSISTFQILESNYDLLQLINLHYFTNILDTLCSFNISRLKLNPVGYSSVEKYLDFRGITVPINHVPTIDVKEQECTENVFKEDSNSFSEHLRSVCESKNVKLYIVPGAFINVNFTENFFTKWNEIYPNALGNILDFEYPFEYFSNSRWHLVHNAAIIFTDQITELIKETGCFNE